MSKHTSMENILIDPEDDNEALFEIRLLSFNSVDDINPENLKLIVQRTIREIPQTRKLRKAAERGKKFESHGRRDDEFTAYLVTLFTVFNDKYGRYPQNREAISALENDVGKGFIHTVDDHGIEWGRNGSTQLTTLNNRFSKVRELLGIKKDKKKSR